MERTESGTAFVKSEQRHIRDAYGLALVAVLASVLGLIIAGVPVASPIAVAAGLLQVAALVLTLRVSGYRKRSTGFGSLIALLAFCGAAFAMLWGGDAGRIVGTITWLVLTVTTIAVIARRLRTYHEVTLQLVMGLLVIYLLLGVTFGLGYTFLGLVAPPVFAQGAEGVSACMYFSFITLATVGYGDLTPISDLARAMAVGEAIVGQLYLVSVVSMAVGRLGVGAVGGRREALEAKQEESE